MGKKTRGRFLRPVILGGLLVVLMLVLGFLAWRWLERIPPVVEQVRAMQRSVVHISNPQNESRWPADASIPVRVRVNSSEPAAEVQLFAGSTLIGSRVPSSEADLSIYSFEWQPLVAGETVLSARVHLADGSEILSAAVSVQIDPPAGAYLQWEMSGEESLAEIAARFQVETDALQDANPQVDLQKSLVTGTVINVPVKLPAWQPPAIEPEGGDEETGLPESGEFGFEAVTAESSWWQNLQLKLQPQLNPQLIVPKAPGLSAAVSGCDVTLTIKDLSGNEEGFLLYRTKVPEQSETVLAQLEGNGGQMDLSYVDTTGAGSLRYSAAAFNAAGESRSQPVMVSLPVDCGGPKAEMTTPDFQYAAEVTSGDIQIIDHMVHLQVPVDLAYLYVGIEGHGWERIPPGDQKFLPGEGDKFDLDMYLEKLINEIPEPTLEVDMEIWGWQNGMLIECGSLHVSVRRTVLRVCGLPDVDCEDDLLRREIVIPPAALPESLTYYFHWETADMAVADDFVWQIAAKPFTGEHIRQAESLIISRGVYQLTQDFSFRLAYLYKDGYFNLGSWPLYGDDYDSNFFDEVYEPPDTPFTLYARVIPFDKDGNKLPTSNTVLLHYMMPMEVDPETVYASNLPSIFNVAFLPETYSPPVLERKDRWGCVNVYDNVYESTEIFLNIALGISHADYVKDQANCSNPVHPTCSGRQKLLLIPANSMVCPANYEEPSGFWHELGELAGGIWNGITSAWDWLVETFESAKQSLVDEIAKVIPGCDDYCRSLIKSGLEVGFTAVTGLPPSLPSYDDLVDEGIAYAVELAAEEIGPLCDETCRMALEEGFKEVVNQAKSSQPSPGCVGTEEAHARGKEPLCLPSDERIRWEPAQGAVYMPAVISVRVWRDEAPDLVTQNALDALMEEHRDSYRLSVTSYGFNDTRMGDWFPLCGFKEGLDGSKDIGYNDVGGAIRYKRQVNEPLDGTLYKPQVLSLPWLQPGESYTVPVVFDLERFWRMNHEYDIGQTQVWIEDFIKMCGDDWPYLYYDGFSQLTVTEECLNDQQIWVPCGNGDRFETVNPSAPK